MLTGVGGAIAYVGGGASAGSGNITFNIKDGSDIANVVDVADEYAHHIRWEPKYWQNG